jgi:murein DD-endopeptidase MepM/ murein hydrolase activator NlpD
MKITSIVAAGLMVAVLVVPVGVRAGISPVVLPIDGYFERQQLIEFGTKVDAAFHQTHRDVFPNGPYPNQYTGYHAGVDVEYHAAEDLAKAVPVRSIADGTVVYKGPVSGYGGLIIVRHEKPEAITSLYGHLRLADSPVQVGQAVTAGQTLAMLGDQFSADTSGARKHLHFGIHRGPSVDLNGYEQSLAALQAGWYNPNDWLRAHLTTAVSTATPAVTPSPTSTDQPKHRSLIQKVFNFFARLFS